MRYRDVHWQGAAFLQPDIPRKWEQVYAEIRRCGFGENLKWDFDTWLMQNYGLKSKLLNKKALDLAKKEYSEEYPPEGETDIKLKTFPFKKYLESQKK